MLNRRFILRALLATLGAAAVTGAVAMLAGGNDVIWRVTFTAGMMAVACGLMLVLMPLSDRRTTRWSALIGVTSIVLLFVLMLAVTWLPRAMMVGGRRIEWPLYASIWSIAIAAPCAMLFAWQLNHKSARIASWTALLSMAVCLMALIVGIWSQPVLGSQRFYWFSERLVGSALACFFLSLLAAAALLGVETHRRPWRWAGVLTSAAAILMSLYGIWLGKGGGEEILATVISIAAFIAHVNVVQQCPLKPGQRWLAHATIIASAVVVVTLDYSLFDRDAANLMLRVTAAASVLSGCGTMALFILALLNRGVNADAAPSQSFIDVRLTCPRCNRSQALPLGKSQCGSCGLRIEVNVEEPRCRQCGYLLYKLQSDACPECGTRVAESPAEISLTP